MRKFLLSAVLVLGIISMASAKEYTLTMGDYADQFPTSASQSFDVEIGDFTFSLNKNSGSTNPTYNLSNKDVRVYAKGTLTITAPENINITSVSFAISKKGLEQYATITPSVGEIAEQGANPLVWNGEANAITYTVSDKADYASKESNKTKAGQFDFDAVTIVTDESDEPVVAEPLYTFQSHAIAYGDSYVDYSYIPKAEATIEVYDGYVKVLNWAGVDGYGMVVGFDEDYVVTYITPIADGVEGEAVESGFVYVYTGLEAPEVTYVTFYVNYCTAGVTYDPQEPAEGEEAEEPGSGYVLFYGYDSNSKYVDYELDWPYDKDAASKESANLYALGDELIQKIAPEFGEAVTMAGGFGDAELADEIIGMIDEINGIIAESMDYFYETGYFYCSADVAAMIDEVKKKIEEYNEGAEKAMTAALEASEEDTEALNDVIKQVSDINALADEYGDEGAKYEYAAKVTQEYEALNSAINDALMAAMETGKYVSPLGEAFDALKADVAAYEQEVKEKVAYNYAAANNEKYAELVKKYTDAKATVDKKYAACGKAEGEKAYELLVDAAYGAAWEDTLDYDAIAAAIEAYEKAAADQAKAITIAADEDIELFAAAYDNLGLLFDESEDMEVWMAAAELMGQLSDYNEMILNAIHVAEYETGVYESPLTAEDKEIIAKIVADAKQLVETAAISTIAADNDAVKYYDLNGVQVQNPANGKVYIRVANGKATKIVK